MNRRAKAENFNREKAEVLRKKISDDVDHTQQRREMPLCFLRFTVFTTILPSIRTLSENAQTTFRDILIDFDMKDDLERSKVINWCRTARTLIPIKTSGDGNCLLHAVSQAMWVLEDTTYLLRRLLYITLSTDPKGRFRRRWLTQQKSSNSDLQRIDVRLNTEEYSNEWENVIKATVDIPQTSGQGLPYVPLESIHLYVLANILRRPIVLLCEKTARNVYGQSMQENTIGGIYLPLEWIPAECCKTPIVIGYNMNHFAPLIGQENHLDEQLPDAARVVPLVNYEFEQLSIHYLLPPEEGRAQNLLQDYLKLQEVVLTGADSIFPILSAKLEYKALPDDLNLLKDLQYSIERQLRLQTAVPAVYNIPPEPQMAEPKITNRVVHVSQNVRAIPHETPATQGLNISGSTGQQGQATAQAQPRAPVMPRQPELQATAARHKDKNKELNFANECITMGCHMYGNPATANMCYKCFKDYTVVYNNQEMAAKNMKAKVEPSAPLPTIPPEPSYLDLSLMGENCHAGCGFKCSVETYPYCHECHPKMKNTGNQGPQVNQVQPRAQPSQTRVPATQAPVVIPVNPAVNNTVPQHQAQYPFTSMMTENCHAGCGFRCSTKTHPYCYECYERFKTQQQPAPTQLHLSQAVESSEQSPEVFTPSPVSQPQEYTVATPEPLALRIPESPAKPLGLQPLSSTTSHPDQQPHSHPTLPSGGDLHQLSNALVGSQLASEPYIQLQSSAALPVQPEDHLKAPEPSSQTFVQPIKQMNFPVETGVQKLKIGLETTGGTKKICKTEGCEQEALRGNNGLCDDCYQRQLFGDQQVTVGERPSSEEIMGLSSGSREHSFSTTSKSSVCSNPGCNDKATVANVCSKCFLEKPLEEPEEGATGLSPIMVQQGNMLPGATGGHPGTVPQENRTAHEQVLSLTGATGPADPSMIRFEGSINPQKIICPTPGCEGARTNNPGGFCEVCARKLNKPGLQNVELMTVDPTNIHAQASGMQPIEGETTAAEQGEVIPSGLDNMVNLGESPTEVSSTPVHLTKKEENEINPVIVSSRQKVKCPGPTCGAMIYPPKKLCDNCTRVLQEAGASKLKKTAQEPGEAHRTGACKTDGCPFFGFSKFSGYCSQCFKDKRGRFTAPLRAAVNPGLSQVKHHTAPLAAKGSSCLELGCTRFGDPSMGGRCSDHYRRAISPFRTPDEQRALATSGQQTAASTMGGNVKPLSPRPVTVPTKQIAPRPLSEGTYHPYAGMYEQAFQATNQGADRTAASQIPVPNYATANQAAGRTVVGGHTQPVQASQSPPDQFSAAMRKVESSRKSSSLCKNHTICGNYGSASREGYCNVCYTEFLKKNLKWTYRT